MRFAPVSEEIAAGCLPKGEYDAVVNSAVEKTSKAGNPMIELELTVYGQAGAEVKVKDWLLGTDTGQGKLQRFCKSADLWETYKAGELSADAINGLNVVAKIGIQESDEYAPKNKVVDYMPRKAPGGPEKAKGELQGVPPTQRSNAGVGRPDAAKPPTSDDIPF